MNKSLVSTAVLLSALLVLVSARRSRSVESLECEGTATYSLIFKNFLTPERFGSRIPAEGLLFSPPVAASHSSSVSLITLREPASQEVEVIAETGNNGPLADLARSLVSDGSVLDVQTSTLGPIMPGELAELNVTVDCEHPVITMAAMVAPSPDWFVQVSNSNMFDSRKGTFIKKSAGYLMAYDAGTDSGREFTNPADTSLDEPTVPAGPIIPLVEDETDAFNGDAVGFYLFKRIE